MSSAVSLRQVVKNYRRGKESVQVLHGLNLEIPEGEFVSLMGPSGSGKTTILNLVGGLDHADSGEVIVGGEHLESVTIRNAETGQSRKVAARALFIMVGAAPNTEWLSGLVKLDDKGFVVTGLGPPASPFATSYPGIFAVGDVRAGSVKRVASAVGEGSVVISKVWEHVKQNTT